MNNINHILQKFRVHLDMQYFDNLSYIFAHKFCVFSDHKKVPNDNDDDDNIHFQHLSFAAACSIRNMYVSVSVSGECDNNALNMTENSAADIHLMLSFLNIPFSDSNSRFIHVFKWLWFGNREFVRMGSLTVRMWLACTQWMVLYI